MKWILSFSFLAAFVILTLAPTSSLANEWRAKISRTSTKAADISNAAQSTAANESRIERPIYPAHFPQASRSLKPLAGFVDRAGHAYCEIAKEARGLLKTTAIIPFRENLEQELKVSSTVCISGQFIGLVDEELTENSKVLVDVAFLKRGLYSFAELLNFKPDLDAEVYLAYEQFELDSQQRLHHQIESIYDTRRNSAYHVAAADLAFWVADMRDWLSH